MKPLDYQTSSTPPRRFQRFNRLEESLGCAGLLSLACAAASLLPLIAPFGLRGPRKNVARLSLLLNLTLSIALLTFAFFRRK